jgi:PAS domain S-box-containing protein
VDDRRFDPTRDELHAWLERLPAPLAVLEGLFVHAPFPLQVFDATGRCLVTNQAFRDLFGSVPPPDYRILEDDVAAARGILGLIRRAFAGETVRTPPTWYDPRELRQVEVREGRRVAVAATFFPLRDASGAIAHVVAMFEDHSAALAARDEAEARRVEAEASAGRMRVLAEATAALSDGDGPARLAHVVVPALGDACVLRALDARGRLAPLAEAAVDPAAAALLPPLEPALEVAVRTGAPQAVDGHGLVAVLCARGQTIGAMAIASRGRRFDAEDLALAVELGRRAGLAIEDARLRRALEAAEARARLAIDAAAIGTWDQDLLAGTLSWDAVCRELFGIGEGPVTMDAFLAALHEEDRATTRAAIARALDAEDGAYRVEYRVVRDGVERWLRSTGQVHRDARGQPVRFIGTVQDVSEEKRAARALKEETRRAEEANQAKDAFLAMLGHELRNPLWPITTALELMRRKDAAAHARERTIIERQVDHMVRLVDDLLDVSRITRGRVTLERRPVALAQAVAKAIEMASPLLEARRHRLTTDVPRDLVVDGDEHRLAQVFGNLLTNAAKYTPPGGAVDVTAAREGARVRVVVRDSGVGIDPELLPHVFDLFTQGTRTIDRTDGGLGLGLTIVRSLVDLHGGAVMAASDGPGRGAELVVTLPLLAAAPAPVEPPAAAGPVGPRRRVLVVDDNRDAADALALILRDAGHEVGVAYDGPQALDLALDLRPEVALLDLGLPVMDGFELAGRLQARDPAPRLLVAITGYGQDSDRARTAAAGFDEHLVKPVEPAAIVHLVEARLAGRA